MIRIDSADGVCRECCGTLVAEAADDCELLILCERCGASYPVEIDAFGDGGTEYWPLLMATQKAAT